MKKVLLLVGCVLLSMSSMFALAEIKSESGVMASVALSTLPMGADNIDFRDYRGKVVLLDFWASWCGPCRQSFPWMNDIQAKYTDQGLVIIAVNLDQEKQAADKFLAEVPATFKVVYDPDGGSAEQMEVMGMPMSYLIDRQGKLRYRLIGFNSRKKKEHEAHIFALLYEELNEELKEMAK